MYKSNENLWPLISVLFFVLGNFLKQNTDKKITPHITINNYYKKFDMQIDFNSNKTYGEK